VHWAVENPFILVDKAVKLPELIAYNWTVLFHGRITGPMYLNMLRTSILPAIHHLYGMSHFTFNKMGHRSTTTKTSEATLMKPYQVNGLDEKVVLSVLSIPHAHLI
jgi:hypothetical protein